MIPHKRKRIIWFNMDSEEFKITDNVMCEKESMYKVNVYGSSEWCKEGATIKVYAEDFNDDEKILKLKQSLVDACIEFKEKYIEREKKKLFNLECVHVRVSRKLLLKTWDELVEEFGVVESIGMTLINCPYGFSSIEEDFVPNDRIINVDVEGSIYIWSNTKRKAIILHESVVKEVLGYE